MPFANFSEHAAGIGERQSLRTGSIRKRIEQSTDITSLPVFRVFPYSNPKTTFMDSVRTDRSLSESSPIFLPNRLLSAAQSWSHTATEVFPAEERGTTMGGRGFADVDNGTTATVPLALFRALTVRITAGRHFWISIPSDGSRLTHHTSPRRIGAPSGLFLTANAVSNQSFTPLAHFRVQRGIPLNLKRKEV